MGRITHSITWEQKVDWLVKHEDQWKELNNASFNGDVQVVIDRVVSGMVVAKLYSPYNEGVNGSTILKLIERAKARIKENKKLIKR